MALTEEQFLGHVSEGESISSDEEAIPSADWMRLTTRL